MNANIDWGSIGFLPLDPLDVDAVLFSVHTDHLAYLLALVVASDYLRGRPKLESVWYIWNTHVSTEKIERARKRKAYKKIIQRKVEEAIRVGISLRSVPEVCGGVLMVRTMEVTERKVSEEHGWWMILKRKRCVDQIFAIEMVVEDYSGKGEKLYTTFMDLEEHMIRVNREALWNALKIYGG